MLYATRFAAAEWVAVTAHPVPQGPQYGTPSTKCTCNLGAPHPWLRLKLAADAPP